MLLLEMESVNSDQPGDEREGRVVSNQAAAAACPSASNDGPSECTENDDENLARQNVEHLHCLADATCSNVAEGDTVKHCEAEDTDSIRDVSQTKSPNQGDEHIADEDSKSVDSVSNSGSQLDDTSKLGHVHEIQPDAPADEDDGWMQVLGNDHLKKRACIITC